MGLGKTWTSEEIEYLKDKWGQLPTNRIASKLNRTVGGVIRKAYVLGLGAYMEASEYIYLKELLEAIGLTYHYRTNNKLINAGLNVRHIKTREKTYMMVSLTDFWNWLEKNKNIISLANMEKNALGAEPNWVDEKRKIDIENRKLSSKEFWTDDKLNLLISKAKSGRYTLQELAIEFKRSEAAIRRILWEFGIKVKYNKITKSYTKKDNEKIKEMRKKGLTPYAIALELGRSEAGIRDKIKRLKI